MNGNVSDTYEIATALRWGNNALKAQNIQAQGETLGAMARRRASPERAAHKKPTSYVAPFQGFWSAGPRDPRVSPWACMYCPFRAFGPQFSGSQGFALGLYVLPFQGFWSAVLGIPGFRPGLVCTALSGLLVPQVLGIPGFRPGLVCTALSGLLVRRFSGSQGFALGLYVLPFQGFWSAGSRDPRVSPWACMYCPFRAFGPQVLGIPGFRPGLVCTALSGLLVRRFSGSRGFALGLYVLPFQGFWSAGSRDPGVSPWACMYCPFRAFGPKVLGIPGFRSGLVCTALSGLLVRRFSGSRGFALGLYVLPFQGFWSAGSRDPGVSLWACMYCPFRAFGPQVLGIPGFRPGLVCTALSGLLVRRFSGSRGFAPGLYVLPFQGFWSEGSRDPGVSPRACMYCPFRAFGPQVLGIPGFRPGLVCTALSGLLVRRFSGSRGFAPGLYVLPFQGFCSAGSRDPGVSPRACMYCPFRAFGPQVLGIPGFRPGLVCTALSGLLVRRFSGSRGFAPGLYVLPFQGFWSAGSRDPGVSPRACMYCPFRAFGPQVLGIPGFRPGLVCTALSGLLVRRFSGSHGFALGLYVLPFQGFWSAGSRDPRVSPWACMYCPFRAFGPQVLGIPGFRPGLVCTALSGLLVRRFSGSQGFALGLYVLPFQGFWSAGSRDPRVFALGLYVLPFQGFWSAGSRDPRVSLWACMYCPLRAFGPQVLGIPGFRPGLVCTALSGLLVRRFSGSRVSPWACMYCPFRAFGPHFSGSQGFALGLYVLPFQGFLVRRFSGSRVSPWACMYCPFRAFGPHFSGSQGFAWACMFCPFRAFGPQVLGIPGFRPGLVCTALSGLPKSVITSRF